MVFLFSCCSNQCTLGGAWWRCSTSYSEVSAAAAIAEGPEGLASASASAAELELSSPPGGRHGILGTNMVVKTLVPYPKIAGEWLFPQTWSKAGFDPFPTRKMEVSFNFFLTSKWKDFGRELSWIKCVSLTKDGGMKNQQQEYRRKLTEKNEKKVESRNSQTKMMPLTRFWATKEFKNLTDLLKIGIF